MDLFARKILTEKKKRILEGTGKFMILDGMFEYVWREQEQQECNPYQS